MRPTDEQAAIIDACAAGQHLVIEAGAGTGKTTTLRMSAERMSGTGLYLAYNKAIQLDAESRFPRHVRCRTAHSVAYSALGKRFRKRLNGPRQPAREVARILRINQPLRLGLTRMLQPTQLARLALDTVARFCRHTATEIQGEHVPRLPGTEDNQHLHIQQVVLPLALAVWNDLQADDNEGSGRIGYQHDHYLKAWSLTNPTLDVDFVLFDEAQDADPVIAQIVQAQQRHAQLIAVGDTNQAIYGWRGATDALQRWPAQRRLYLTQSWRFGPAIAAEANKWLTLLNAQLRLTGDPCQRSIVTAIPGWPDAVLCRTNGTAMSEAMAAIAAGKRTALVGGASTIRRLAEAAIELQRGNGTHHPELAMFRTWGELQDYVTHEQTGSDLRSTVALIDRYGPTAVIEATTRLTDDKHRTSDPPELIISTSHKAKGLEWSRVRIANDFSEPPGPVRRQLPIQRPEAMLAYVAVTRARHTLDRGGLSWIDTRLATNGAQNR